MSEKQPKVDLQSYLQSLEARKNQLLDEVKQKMTELEAAETQLKNEPHRSSLKLRRNTLAQHLNHLREDLAAVEKAIATATTQPEQTANQIESAQAARKKQIESDLAKMKAELEELVNSGEQKISTNLRMGTLRRMIAVAEQDLQALS